MMPIAELVAVAGSLDGDHRCPAGDEAAQRWGATRAVFLRSSASHVFVTDASYAGGRLVLRMRPHTEAGAADVLARSARAAADLHRAGAPVARSVPSSAGALVESVDRFAVTALEAVEGDPIDSDDVDADTAEAWGSLLADLHSAGHGITLDSGPPGQGLANSAADPPGLPRTPDVYGLLHGDPELDNVVWTAAGGTFVDPDDVRYGWFAADVAFALRDWSPPAGGPDLGQPVPRAFVAGYRARRALSDDELSWLPTLARRSAAATLRRLQPVLAERPQPRWPAWAHDLDRRVRARAKQLDAALR